MNEFEGTSEFFPKEDDFFGNRIFNVFQKYLIAEHRETLTIKLRGIEKSKGLAKAI